MVIRILASFVQMPILIMFNIRLWSNWSPIVLKDIFCWNWILQNIKVIQFLKGILTLSSYLIPFSFWETFLFRFIFTKFSWLGLARKSNSSSRNPVIRINDVKDSGKAYKVDHFQGSWLFLAFFGDFRRRIKDNITTHFVLQLL